MKSQLDTSTSKGVVLITVAVESEIKGVVLASVVMLLFGTT